MDALEDELVDGCAWWKNGVDLEIPAFRLAKGGAQGSLVVARWAGGAGGEAGLVGKGVGGTGGASGEVGRVGECSW